MEILYAKPKGSNQKPLPTCLQESKCEWRCGDYSYPTNDLDFYIKLGNVFFQIRITCYYTPSGNQAIKAICEKAGTSDKQVLKL